MDELIITTSIISMITLGIILLKYIEQVIIDIKYIKNSQETKKNLNRKIEKQEEQIINYLKQINYLEDKIEEIKKENKKEKKGDLPF